MTAKLRLELENRTGPGFDAIVKDLKRMGIEGDDAEKAIEQLNKELGSRAATENAKRMAALADQLVGTTEKAEALQRAEKQAADAMARVTSQTIAQNSELHHLESSVLQAAKRAGTLTDYQRDLQKALDERKVRAYRAEIDRLADAMTKLPNSGAGGAAGGMGGMFGGLSGMGKALPAAGAALAVVATLQKVGQMAGFVFQKGAELVQFLSDKGVPAFVNLKRSADGAANAFIEMAKDQRVAKWVNTSAGLLNTKLVPSLQAAANTALALGDYAFEAGKSMLELAGVDFKPLEESLKKAAQAEKEAANKKTKDERKKEADQLLVDLQADRGRNRDQTRIGSMTSMKDVDAESAAALARFHKARAQMETANKQQFEDAKAMAQKQRELYDALQARKQQLLDAEEAKTKELANKKIEADRQAADNKNALTKQAADNEIAVIDALLARHKGQIESIQVLELKREELIAKNKDKTTDGPARRANEAAIKALNEQLTKARSNNDKIQELEKRRNELVERNNRREQELAKEKGTLQQTLHEQELERIKFRHDREIEEGNLRLQIEEEIDRVKKQKLSEQEAAHQQQVDKLKQFMLAFGGGDAGGGGQPGPQPGQPPMGQPPGKPGPKTFKDQLAAMMSPKALQQQVIKNREDKAYNTWKEENKLRMDAEGYRYDAEGNLLPGQTKLDKLTVEQRFKQNTANWQREGRKVRRDARMDAFSDIKQGKVKNEEVANAQGDLLTRITEKLAQDGHMSQVQIDAIRQAVEELSRMNTENARLKDQMKEIQDKLNGLGQPGSGHGSSF